jgi:DNA-binding response OmpR family regulator
MTPARILLVDDEPSLLLTVGDLLKLEGYDVTTAQTGEDAILAMRRQTPDLIILDISMPGMTGLALLKKLSGPDGKPHYPILIFSARANMEAFFKTTAVEGFLAKTSDPTQLLAEVKRILLKTRKDARTEPQAGSKSRRMVLILEDDPTLNMRMKTSFTIAGYETLTITDGHALAQTLQSHSPSVILLKSLLSGTTGNAIAESLADYTTARGISIILYDASGIHKPGDKFINVTRFIPSNNPADLLKATTALLS